MDVKKVLWDFGNGKVSNDFTPIVEYAPGWYDVILTVETVGGSVYTTEHKMYIGVTENNQSLTNSNYFDNPKCLHYGWNSGWAEYGGDNWIWPGTPASVTEFLINDKMTTLAWDIKDNKRYELNVEETNLTTAVYKDRMNNDYTGGVNIETSIKLPEYTGEQQHYDVSHLETYLAFRPERLSDGLPADFAIDVSLITDVDELPVETQKKADYLREIVFYYQNKQTKSTQSRQLQIKTDTSEYQLINYESYFKINDRFRTPSFSVKSDPQAFFAGAINWATKGLGYNYNRATATETLTGYTPTTGPDGDATSAADLTSTLKLTPTLLSGGVAFWYEEGNKPAIKSPSDPDITTLDYGTSNGWVLTYWNGSLPADSFIDSGYKVFDLRVFDGTLLEDYLSHYFENYKLYLPR
jgi:hypothetical protein